MFFIEGLLVGTGSDLKYHFFIEHFFVQHPLHYYNW